MCVCACELVCALLCEVLRLCACVSLCVSACVYACLCLHICTMCCKEGHADNKQCVILFSEQIMPLIQYCNCYYMWLLFSISDINYGIDNAVQNSRRTIIVLSKYYLESGFTSHEADMAIDMVHEGKQIVIVIVLESVMNDPRLTPKLKTFLGKGTYSYWIVIVSQTST